MESLNEELRTLKAKKGDSPEAEDSPGEMDFAQSSPVSGSVEGLKKRTSTLSKYERNSIVKTTDADLDFSEIEIMI
jgi:hypothetical protein